MYSLEPPPPRMTPEIYYHRFQAHFPSKRAHVDTRSLQVGQEVSFKGFSASLVKFVPSRLDPDSTCVICTEEVGDAPPAPAACLSHGRAATCSTAAAFNCGGTERMIGFRNVLLAQRAVPHKFSTYFQRRIRTRLRPGGAHPRGALHLPFTHTRDNPHSKDPHTPRRCSTTSKDRTQTTAAPCPPRHTPEQERTLRGSVEPASPCSLFLLVPCCLGIH